MPRPYRRFARTSEFSVKPLLTDSNQEELIKAILKGMSKTIASGVSKYTVGSRSLERWSINDIYRLLELTQQLQAPPVARRAIPTDM